MEPGAPERRLKACPEDLKQRGCVSAAGRGYRFDSEDRVFGGDAAQLLVRRVRAHASKERAYLDLPFSEVGPQDRQLLVVADLRRGEAPGPPAEPELTLVRDTQISHPLRCTTRRHEVLGVLEHEKIHLCRAPLPTLASPHRQHAASVDAQSEASKTRHDQIEDVVGKPARFLIGRHAVILRLLPAKCGQTDQLSPRCADPLLCHLIEVWPPTPMSPSS